MAIPNGSIYVSPSSQDPSGQGGFNGSGNIWVQSDTGNWLTRNSSNTGWSLIGSGEQQSFGLFPISGGAGSGAISGNTGLITADGNTPFAVPPTITNKSSAMATLYDLSLLQTNLKTLIDKATAQAISGVISPGINSNISFAFGVLPAALTSSLALVLPISGMQYPDGSSVALSECFGFASFNTVNAAPDYGQAPPPGLTGLYLTPQDSRGMSWLAYTSYSVFSLPASINYQIIAIRSSS